MLLVFWSVKLSLVPKLILFGLEKKEVEAKGEHADIGEQISSTVNGDQYTLDEKVRAKPAEGTELQDK